MDDTVLTGEQVQIIAEIAANLALEKYQRMIEHGRQERKDRNLRNTKKLMRLYPALRTHSESSIFELSKICDEEIFDVISQMTKGYDEETLKVESIKSSATRTMIILEHIDLMLEAYRQMCLKSGKPEDERRYRVLYGMYLADQTMTPTDIAQKERIDTRTVYKDIDSACERLSIYIFGADAF